ncbi:MAG: glycosyltransferase family 4 protein [bacterium]|nr:glycosyltransferase family 4 protein [bacterium]
MKLLFITQKVDKDDGVLGVYHRWIEELARRFDKVSVICLYQGRTDLPANVSVYSLGKEKLEIRNWKFGIWKRLIYVVKFYRLIWGLRREYDAVFVHMNPEYVILGGIFWRLAGKKIILWYAHYLANWRIRLAAKLANRLVTSIGRAFPFPSRKLVILQQGIDTEKFKSIESKVENEKFRVLFLGRISSVKNLDVLLRAFQLASPHSEIELSVVGGPTPGKNSEAVYFEQIKKMAGDLNIASKVKFYAPVPNFQAPVIYNQHDLFVNLTVTGSFDKSTLEAMSCGLPILVSNLAFKEILPKELRDRLMFPEKDYLVLASKIKALANLSEDERHKIGVTLRELVIAKHGLDDLMDKLQQAIFSA